MSSTAMTAVVEDQAWPALAQALDPDLMLTHLVQASGHLDDGDRLNCSAEVLNHKLGRRCTIRYTLARSSQGGGPLSPRAIIGKLYRETDRAARIYRWTQALGSGPFNGRGRLCIPAPLKLVPDLGLVLLEYVDGADLRQSLPAANNDSPLSLAAQWLARLHTAPPLAGLKVKSLEHEIGKVDRWCKEITPHLQLAEARRLRQNQDILHALAGRIRAYTPVMIHRDFYPANILWDGQRVWVLDLDQLSVGDPALDVGHLLAQLENLAYRTTGRVNAFADQAVLFLKSYSEENPVNLQLRLPFYRAYTFLKLAAKEVRRQREEWQRRTRVLAGLACQEVGL